MLRALLTSVDTGWIVISSAGAGTNSLPSGHADQDERHVAKQGPWTDIYSLGATLCRVINGEGPVDALTRVNSVLDKTPDPLMPATELGAGQYSQRFLEAIDAAMRFDAQDRPQDVAAWRAMLPEGGELPDMQGISNATLAWAEWESRQSGEASARLTGLRGQARVQLRRVSRYTWLISGVALALAAVSLWYFMQKLSVPEQPPITRTVVSPPNSARDDEIGELMRIAAADVDALRLTSPAGDNAYERYQQVLSREPDNENAMRGLEVIVMRYVTLANTALSNGELDKAKHYLDSAGGVLPEDKGVALARRMLTAAVASRSSTATPGPGAAPTPALGSPPGSAPGSAPRPAPGSALAAPRRVAVLPFWGRQTAQASAEGVDLSVELSEFVHNYVLGRGSLELIYSYYQPGFEHASVNAVGDLWVGGAVNKKPRTVAIREIGRELGADGVLLFGYEPKPGAGAEVHVYLMDVGDGRMIRRQGDLANLAKITRESFEEWTGAGE